MPAPDGWKFDDRDLRLLSMEHNNGDIPGLNGLIAYLYWKVRS